MLHMNVVKGPASLHGVVGVIRAVSILASYAE